MVEVNSYNISMSRFLDNSFHSMQLLLTVMTTNEQPAPQFLLFKIIFMDTIFGTVED